MTAADENSVTQWVSDLKAGDRSEATRRLWERYFERLARLARTRLGTAPEARRMRRTSRSAFSIASSAGPPPGAVLT